MSISTQAIQQALGGAKQALAEAKYVVAINLLAPFSDDTGLTTSQQRSLCLYRLTAYNRLQWLVNARQQAALLRPVGSLRAEELLEMALCDVICGRPESARIWFGRALKLSPGSALLRSEIALTYEQQGNTGKAQQIFDQLALRYVQSGEFDEPAMRIFSRLAEIRSFNAAEARFLERVYKKNKVPVLATQAAFIMAAAARKAYETDREIDWLILGNQRSAREDQQKGLAWSAALLDEQFAILQARFSEPGPKWLVNKLAGRVNEARFIFVLGMPRSGTTLVEQILGAHSQVGNTGESRGLSAAITRAVMNLGNLVEAGSHSGLRNLSHLSGDAFVKLAADYCAHQKILASEPVLTDKNLSNYPWVGLWANLFPNARFVYVYRDPLDNCVSLLQRPFQNAPFSNNPVQCIGEFLAYKKTMDHWEALYPDRVAKVHYEQLVASPKDQLLPLFGALGLEWQEGVLGFYARGNSVRTPSVGQVRSKMNTSQVRKWEKYTRLLGPAVELAASIR